MAGFKREELTVNGVKTVVHSAGKGRPVVFLHGAGTIDGYDFTVPWTEKFRVIAPYHPGFGESGDDPSFTTVHDYVMHYLELFDMLGLDSVDLVGVSLGGYLAAAFASEHGHRVRRLVLIAPAGIIDEKHPSRDLLMVPGELVPPMLVSNFEVLRAKLPEKPDLDFIGERYRESGTFARLMWEHPRDPKFMRHLHRINMPTLILWGEEDQIIPVQQAKLWRKHLPHAEVKRYKSAGHLVHLDRPETVTAIADFLS
jgi:pimeloyl-ACP methyl ester carboxylesterase